MTHQITPESLKTWRKAEGLTQEDLANMIGWKKLIVTNIETGRREISDPEQRLLKLLIHGELPFEIKQNPYDPKLDFTHEEWVIMTHIAHREGHRSPRTWIIQRIRDCLAMRQAYPAQDNLKVVAEDPGDYNKSPKSQKPNGNLPKAE